MGLFWDGLFGEGLVLCDVDFVGIEIILIFEIDLLHPGRTTHVLNVYTAGATKPAFSGTTSNRSVARRS